MFKLTREEIREGKADSIRRAIERAILDERLKPGDALPTVRSLAEDLGINKNTVVAAYRQLQQAGLVTADGRRGSTVFAQASSRQDRGASARDSRQTLSVRDGNPDIEFLPDEAEIRNALGRMTVAHHLYGERRNFGPFLDWATERFAADHVDVPHGVFVSAGALDLVERALSAFGLEPGDRVAVEDPSYMTLLALARSMGFQLLPLELDQNGIVPASLRGALKRGAKAVLTCSRSQNPTGIATSKSRAAELKRVAGSAGEVLFIDDDHSNLLELAPYYAWHTDAPRWLTVRSLSKLLGPDFRIAVSTGDAETIAQLESRQSVGMGWISTFLQRLAFELLTSASVQKKITAAGLAYRDRYQSLQAALKKKGFKVTGSAGLNLWIPIQNETEVAERLFDAGWLVCPGREFCVTEQPGIRVTSSRMTTQQSLAFTEALLSISHSTATTLIA
ncbi:aminotransferase class I/II-fold pyridoxal phosphate-dependent enzyme [Paraburkholderia susongensis]|uniref:DNA-binding transcriptional regulator, MocR family, contains an aminotransferase domain n=1 Tax=Paraburkholderia susongensis TaxID=1515439 RepID=A0A1X7IBJ0_9BURK|nr:aminotransferase class I/II-fold pyridoxal phosphate-dependent enzyme [Paraburkholderia susongensis]SMG12019.1 DNA-binding transcriptional regulator, MocR family, contains an aminotransferase domain [Paraburkholderia susongensis]